MIDRRIKSQSEQQDSIGKGSPSRLYAPPPIEKVIEAKNWSDTNLGPKEDWPQSLKVAFNVCLSSSSPMGLFWGDELTLLYNDAWGELFENHSLFGLSARKVFKKERDIVTKLNKVVSTGRAITINNRQLPFPSKETAKYNISLKPLSDGGELVTGAIATVNPSQDKYKSNTGSVVLKGGEPSLPLGKREQFMNSIFETTPECIKIVSPEGNILQMNSAGLKMVEAESVSAVIGRNVFDLIAPEHLQRYKKFHKEICAGESGSLQFDIIGFNGNRRHMETHAAPLPNASGTADHLALTYDISERKRQEERDHFLLKLNDALRPLSDPEKMKNEAIHILGEHLSASRVFYAELEEKEEYLTFENEYLNDTSSCAGRYRLSDFGKWTEQIRRGEVVAVPDIYSCEDEFQLGEEELQAYEEVDVQAFVSVPLVKQEQLVAYLGVHQTEAREWTAEELSLIRETAERTWDAVERASTERALLKSSQRYRTLFESMDEGYCIIEMIYDEDQHPVDYRFLEVNPSFEDHTGLKDVEGKTMREIIPSHEEDWFEIYSQVVKTGEPIRFEQPAQALDRIFELYAFPFGEPEGHQVAVLFQDITRRKQNERSDALLGAIVEGSDDAIVSKNLEGIITSWNPGAERMFGYYAEEIIGKPVTTLMPPERVQEEEYILNELKQGRRLKHFETVRKRKNGELLDVSLTISPIRDSSGNIIGASKIARDITERKKTEAKLQELNEKLEKRVKERTNSLLSYQNQLRSLASKLSKAEELERHRLATELHDNLGQMLAVGKMKIDLLRNDKLPDSTSESIEELKELLDDSLIYTRELMSDLKPPPSLDKEDMRASIRWVAQKMEKHDLDVQLIDDGEPKKVSNEIRTTLLQCVRELLFNVIKHAQVDEAQINMKSTGKQICIVVEDKGGGFDPDEITSTSTEEGGFGLFNIKERMDLLGGTITIDSQLGEGTQVTLLAPLKEQPPAVTEQETLDNSTVESEENDKVHVLLVDDHKMIREGLRKIVEDQDDLVVIAEASDGKEAIEAAKEKNPDVVIMDIDMPGMNGIDATQKILSDKEDARVIGLSLHGHKSVVESMRKAGASAYLTKNEAFETLCATIRSEAATAKN